VFPLRLLPLPAVLSLLVACGADVAEPGTTSANELHSGSAVRVVSGCEDVLVPREALPHCDGETCAQVQREPERTVHWYLTLEKFYPINEYQDGTLSAVVLEHQIDCVLRQLQNLGVAPERRESGGLRKFDDITVEASFEQIQSVLYTTVVNRTELSCVEADCQRCETLSESECYADAFCSPIGAQRLNDALGCWENRYAGCYRGRAVCTDALVTAVSADGACWLFFDGCQPPGFRGNSRAAECDYASFDTVSQCGQ